MARQRPKNKKFTAQQISNLEKLKYLEEINQLKKKVNEEINVLEEVREDVDKETQIKQEIDKRIQKNLQTDENIKKQIHFDNSRVHFLNQEIIADSVQLNDLKPMISSVKDTIGKQNHSLIENLQYLQNKNSADQQKIFYQQLQNQYLVITNFYLFYLFMVLSIIWGYYWFFMKTGYNIYWKWFLYLNLFFYPYLAIYFEFALYLIGKFFISWINGNPFYFWNNYTSYPPIV
jgi:hypothetical protein